MSIFATESQTLMLYGYSISGEMFNINVTADVLEYTNDIKGVFSSYPAAARNPDYDIVFDCLGQDRFGVRNQGVLVYDYGISGSWLNITIEAGTLEYDYALSGTAIFGLVFNAEDSVLEYDYALEADFYFEMAKSAWVMWSDIGHLDFHIDDDNPDNVAGERPMEWSGVIHDILKLNKSVIVYGSNGIAEMKKVPGTYSYRNVYAKGTKGRSAQVVNYNEDRHWFVDVIGQLWEIGEGVTKHDYSEYLSALNNPVLSLNEEDNLLYLCDGTIGYVFNYETGSMAKGYPNVSGFGFYNGSSLVVAPEAVSIPAISFTTNIYDMGTRKKKIIWNLEFHTNVSQIMEVAIEFRNNIRSVFVSTPWAKITQEGRAFLPCEGIEFKFKFRMLVYESFSLDQVKINGAIHGFSFLDTIRKEN